ncbi:MAG: autotransporter domain-containing protein, partial [Comamonadaceae bacterium]
RSVGFTGFANNLKADYDVSTAQVFGEIGRRIDMGTVALEPFAGLAYVNVDADGFTESGGAAALRSGGGSTDATFSTLGVRASTQVGEATRLRGTVGWRHAFGDRTPTSTHAFATGNAFTVAGVPLAKDVAVLEAGVETQLQRNMTLGVGYAGQLGDGLKDHGLKVSLGWKF